MNKKSTAILSVLALGWGLLAGAQPAAAISLDFVPQNQTVLLGDQATVDVVVDPMGSLVGVFDIIVGWDASIIDLASLAVDPANDLGATIDIVDTLGSSNSVNVVSLSLEFPLDPFQDGTAPVTLFSLTFDTLAVGTSPLSFSPGIMGFVPGGFLGDDFGFLLDTPANDGSITVVDIVRVPAPATLLLLATGMIGFTLRRRPRATHC